MNSTLDWLLFGILPYAAIATFVIGMIWRYRFDKYGWGTRSSELYEKKWLIIGAMLFHYGTLMAIGGHVIGILIPYQWTRAVGITEAQYTLVAKVGGGTAVVAVIAGLAILTSRRVMNPRVRRATTRMDVVTFAILWTMIVLGFSETVLYNILGPGYNYRPSVSEWFRGIFLLQPDPSKLDGAPMIYLVHITVAWLFFALFPWGRLVHAFSVPVFYLTRPYVVYRSRTAAHVPTPGGSRKWQTIGRD